MVSDIPGEPLKHRIHYHKARGRHGRVRVFPAIVFTELCTRKIVLAIKKVRARGKGQKERILPLNASLEQCLQKYLQFKAAAFPDNNPAALLVTAKAQPLYPKLVYRIVKHYTGLVTTSQHRNPHMLRHTFATHLLDNGADLNAIKELLGHSSLAATQVYTHNSIEKLKAIFEKAHPKA